jgi:hypothetical protein
VTATYHGKPCPKCGNTERYTCNRMTTCKSRCSDTQREADRRWRAQAYADGRKWEQQPKNRLRQRIAQNQSVIRLRREREGIDARI